MREGAKVHSVDALEAFRGHLVEFILKARQALGTSEMEIQHTIEWLEQQKTHWKAAIRCCEEEVLRAQNELTARKLAKADRRGTTEPELALKKAKARLEHAQGKLEATKRCLLTLPQAIIEYQGPARQLAGVLDIDLQKAVALLERRHDALEAYLGASKK